MDLSFIILIIISPNKVTGEGQACKWLSVSELALLFIVVEMLCNSVTFEEK